MRQSLCKSVSPCKDLNKGNMIKGENPYPFFHFLGATTYGRNVFLQIRLNNLHVAGCCKGGQFFPPCKGTYPGAFTPYRQAGHTAGATFVWVALFLVLFSSALFIFLDTLEMFKEVYNWYCGKNPAYLPVTGVIVSIPQHHHIPMLKW